MNKIAVSVTEKGFPCLWEEGGNGRSIVIANEYGAPKQALYTKTKGSINARHSLVSIEAGDIIVEVKNRLVSVFKVKDFKEDENGFSTKVFNTHQEKNILIKEVSEMLLRKRGIKAVEDSFSVKEDGLFVEVSYDYMQKYALVELIGQAEEGDWKIIPPSKYIKVIEAAQDKASDMVCTETYFAIPKVKKVL